MDSILTSVKKMLGIPEEYEQFDMDIIMHINSVLMILTQLGVGPEEGFVITDKSTVWADFIGDSNIIDAIMIQDELVQILGTRFACVDKGFGNNKPVDVMIRPEDIELVAPEKGIIEGIVTHLIFKGVHYEMEVTANGFEWLVHSTVLVPVGTRVGIDADPFNMQIMHKPESEDEEAVAIDE